MSVEDVCELGGLLRGQDDEKRIFEKKISELDGVIQSQEGRVSKFVPVRYLPIVGY